MTRGLLRADGHGIGHRGLGHVQLGHRSRCRGTARIADSPPIPPASGCRRPARRCRRVSGGSRRSCVRSVRRLMTESMSGMACRAEVAARSAGCSYALGLICSYRKVGSRESHWHHHRSRSTLMESDGEVPSASLRRGSASIWRYRERRHRPSGAPFGYSSRTRGIVAPYDAPVILWLNGPFGVGKTATAQAIKGRAPRWRLFDPEQVGLLLKLNLGDLVFADFQELPPWRSLVPEFANEISTFTGDDLVAVQSVLIQQHWNDLEHGFSARRMKIFHVVLDAPPHILETRIRADQIDRGAEQWRLDHIPSYVAAKSWLHSRADLVVDTSSLDPAESASRILGSLG